MKLGDELTPEAEEDRAEFNDVYGIGGNCSCHISPPCGSCTHPGNPRNQDEDPSCWINSYEGRAEYGSW